MRTLRASVEGFAELEADTGLPVDFHQTGSVRLCLNRDRLDEFRHHAGVAATAGVPVEIVDAARTLELFPLLDVEDVLAAAWLPTDGHVDPTALTNAFAAGARSRGVTIVRHAPVQALTREGDAWTVETPQGTRPRARRRDRRGPVVAAGRPPGRRQPADRAAAAPLRRDRRGARGAGPDARAARPARPRGVLLRPPGGRGPRRRAVRAGAAHVGPGRDPGRLPRQAPAARPRPDRERAGAGRVARAAVRAGRVEDRAERPGRLHARRPLPDGADPRHARAARAGGLQHLRHRLLRRRRAAGGRVARRGAAVVGRVGARRAALRRLRELAALRRGAGLPGLRARVRHPLPARGAARRPAAAHVAAVRPAAGARRGLRRALGLGAAAVVRRGRRGAGRRRAQLPAHRLARGGRPRVPRRARRRRDARPVQLREVHRQRRRRRVATWRACSPTARPRTTTASRWPRS